MRIDLPEIFKDKQVTVIGGGSSLINFDFDRIQGDTIAVNESYKFVDSSMLVFLDIGWYVRNKQNIDRFSGPVVSGVSRPGIIQIEYESTIVDDLVQQANSSGFTAMVLALILGASKVYLFGFDACFVDGVKHFHGNYRERNMQESEVSKQIELYEYFKNYRIINVGMDSKIDCFQKVPLDSDFYNY